MKVRGLLLTVDTGDDLGLVSVCEIEEMELDEFYKALNCTTIDIVTRKIGGQTFDIVCDDEALLKDGARPSAFNSTKTPMLFGSLFVCKNEGSHLASLTDDDIVHLLKNIDVSVAVKQTGALGTYYAYPVLSNVAYVG